MALGVDIEEQCEHRTFQLRPFADVEGKATASDFCTALEVENSQLCADLQMAATPLGRDFFGAGTNDDVPTRVGADRDAFVRDVRYPQEELFQLGFDSAEFVVISFDAFPELAHLADEFASVAAGFFQLGDLFACAVALMLELIVLANKLAAACIECKDSVERDGMLLVLGVAFDNVGMFSDEAQIKHWRSFGEGTMSAKLPQRLQGGGIFAVQVQQAGCACMDRDLARAIYERSHLQGDFLLRSGQRSSVYFDKYLFECEPALLRRIADRMAQLVPSDAEVLAGLELGGIPLVTALGLATGMPMAFVRKKAKSYGTCKLAEGAPIEGRRVVVIEDVVTSGGQVAESIAALIERGARVDFALCVIDREQGGRELLASNGVELRSLFTMRQLEEAAR